MPDTPAGAAFRAEFDRLNVKLPLQLSPYDIGDVIDANGRHVCICDLNCQRTLEDTVALATCIITAVNTCAGAMKSSTSERAAGFCGHVADIKSDSKISHSCDPGSFQITN